jgi:hypothetical protein
MEDLNQQIQAFLEKRDAERVSARLRIKFQVLEKGQADEALARGDFEDVFSSTHLQQDAADDSLKDAVTENISISGLKLVGDMRLVGGKALNEGAFLLVEITLPEAPIAVRAMATVIWSEADNSNPVIFNAGLFFVGINRQDVMKVARFLILQRRAKHA